MVLLSRESESVTSKPSSDSYASQKHSIELNKCVAQVDTRIKLAESNETTEMCGCFAIIKGCICNVSNAICTYSYQNYLEASIRAGFYDMFSIIKLLTLLMLPLKIHQRLFL